MLDTVARRGFGVALVVGAVALAAPFGAMAADGPVTIVVPYAAGDTSAAFARNGQYEKVGGPEALDAQLAADKDSRGKVIADNSIVLAD